MQREYSKCLEKKNRYLVCKVSELLSCSRQRNKKVQKSLVNFTETIGITADATEPAYKLKGLFIYLFQASIKKKKLFYNTNLLFRHDLACLLFQTHSKQIPRDINCLQAPTGLTFYPVKTTYFGYIN